MALTKARLLKHDFPVHGVRMVCFGACLFTVRAFLLTVGAFLLANGVWVHQGISFAIASEICRARHNPEPRSEVWWWNLRWSFGGKCFWQFSQQKKLENLLPNFAGSSPPISPKTSPTSLWKSLVLKICRKLPFAKGISAATTTFSQFHSQNRVAIGPVQFSWPRRVAKNVFTKPGFWVDFSQEKQQNTEFAKFSSFWTPEIY